MTRELGFAIISLVLLNAASAPAEDDSVDFNKQVRPILSDRCFACHGPDEEAREADLRLDTFAGATADLGDLQAISPGNSARSALIERVTSSDDDFRMPPAGSEAKLTEAEVLAAFHSES